MSASNQKPNRGSNADQDNKLTEHQNRQSRTREYTSPHPKVVGEGGLEPPRPCGHWHLKPARLPIPPLARVDQQP